MTAPRAPQPPLTPAGQDAELRGLAFRGARVLVIRHVVVLAMSAVGTTVLLRSMAPSEWGSYATSYFVLVGLDALLTAALLVELLRFAGELGEGQLVRAQGLVVVAGLALATLTVGGALALQTRYPAPHLIEFAVASAACLLLYAMRAVPMLMLERDLRYRPVALAESMDMAAFYVIALGGLALGLDATALALATVARGAASLAVLRLAQPAPWIGRELRAAGRLFLPRGLPLAAVAAVSLLDGLVPALALGASTREVGFFTTASAVLGYALAGATAAQRVALPALARARPATRPRTLTNGIDIVAAITCLALVALAGLPHIWVRPLLGEAWADAAGWLAIIGTALVVAAPRGLLIAALTQTGASHAVLRAQVTATGMYLCAAVLAVAIAGPIGCAVAYVGSRWLWALVVARAAHRQLGFALRGRVIWVPVASAAAIAALNVVGRISAVGSVAAACVLMGVGALLARGQLTSLVRG